MLPLATIVALAVLAFACGPAPMPVSQSAHDPSSPSAPEGILVSARSDEAPPAPKQATADAGAEPHGAVYVCPMHPEVTYRGHPDDPGRCPKCNMKLVPKK
jgi:hypothetical protein